METGEPHIDWTAAVAAEKRAREESGDTSERLPGNTLADEDVAPLHPDDEF